MPRGEEVRASMELLVKERAREKRLDLLRRDTVRKIDFLRHKIIIEYREVYQLIREFFKEFLEKRYEFTIGELRTELRSVYIPHHTRASIKQLLDNFEATEYATVHYARDDLIKLLDRFEEVVEQLVHTHTAKLSLWAKIIRAIRGDEDPSTIISEVPVNESNDANKIMILTLIEQCYIAMDKHNIKKAKSTYHKLLQAYETLDDMHKEELYATVQQTYRDLLAREKMLS